MLEIYQYHVISVYFLPEYGAALPNSKCSVNLKNCIAWYIHCVSKTDLGLHPDTSTVDSKTNLSLLHLQHFRSITAVSHGWKWCFNSWMMTLLKEVLPEACDVLAQVCVWELSANVCSGESMVFRSSQSNKYKFHSLSYGYAISVEH